MQHEKLKPQQNAEKKKLTKAERAVVIGYFALLSSIIAAGGKAGYEQAMAKNLDPGTTAPITDVGPQGVERSRVTSPESKPAFTRVDMGNTKTVTYLPEGPAPTQEMREDDDFCETADVHLANTPSVERAVEGANTPMVLAAERVKDAKAKFDEVGSREEVNSVVATVLGEAGITVRFDGELGAWEDKEQPPADNEDSVKAYKEKMALLLKGYAMLPKGMLSDDTVTFMNTAEWDTPPGSHTEHAGGTYRHKHDRIDFAVLSASETLVIHEYAHAAHYKACENADDAELEAEYEQALEYLEKLKESPNTEGLSQEELNRLAGFPSDYSKKNFVEFMAETSEILLTRGYITDASAYKPDSPAFMLQKTVVDRLQTAMPGVNVPGYLEFLTVYKPYEDTGRDAINPQLIHEYKASPLDMNFSSFINLGEGAKLRRAVEIEGTYVYATDLSDSAIVTIKLTGDKAADQKIKEAAVKYMERLSEHASNKMDVTEVTVGTVYDSKTKLPVATEAHFNKSPRYKVVDE